MVEQLRACRRAHGTGFTIPGAEADYAPDLALEPVHVDVTMRFETEAEEALGTVTTTVRCNRTGARALRLDAVAFEDVEVKGVEQWRYDGTNLHLTWGEPFSAGEERKVEVKYAVRSPVSGLHFSRPDEAYPKRALFVFTDHETERARYWLPCVDYPTVRPTFEFHITSRSDHTILANGTLVREDDHGDGTKTAHWSLDHPCPSYLCCLAAGRFTRFVDESVDGRPVEYYAAEDIPADWLRRAFGKTPGMLSWLAGRLGVEFPFPKYFQLALPGIGGAMENISLVTWDEALVLDEALAKEWELFVDSVNIHEMAHSYFGDAVVCRHFEHAWLKESWATYVETVWREETLDTDEAHYDLHCNAGRYFEEADTKYVRPIVTRTYNTSWDLFDAHLYPGGAWRIHMLRHLVGDEGFWAGTKDYLKTYSRGTVETGDFRKKLEQHSGLNLVPFFDQWIHSKGYPKLKATYKHDAEKNEGTLVVEQTQEDKKKGIGLFKFPLEIEYTDDAGSHSLTLAVEGRRTTAILKTEGKCAQLLFDPGCKALFCLEFNPGDDMLRKTLREARDIRNRIRAAEELVKTGTRANLDAVREALAAEPFWGVRLQVARALGKSGHAAAIPVLAERLLAEQDPRVQRFLAEACGRMRDQRLRTALREYLASERTPFARAGALQSLGAQRNEQDFELLVGETATESIHGIVVQGALRGIGAMRSEKALAFLEGRLPYGAEPETSRPAVAEAYGACAARMDRDARRRAADALADVTRDKQQRMRWRAGAALGSLNESSAIPALRSLKKAEAAQDTPRIERWIAKLRKGGEGEESQKLREQVEKLEERCRKLDERIQEIEAR